ncbi:hypothetical protein [Faecalicatena fissicatena]|uniref:Uncharacterized protein n=1 Tax=Faecalicatena fissicatena TaxID=290055 RepID=A0ABS2E9J5_9FIRM|nr:hypothetical protein [Faecalicatena fissicatena]MBM6738293.1 hypothetical protein [Faecalicatena fissicatena]
MPEKRTGEKTGQERGSVCKAADAPVGLKTEKEIFKKVIDKSGFILYIIHVAYEIYAALAQ